MDKGYHIIFICCSSDWHLKGGKWLSYFEGSQNLQISEAYIYGPWARKSDFVACEKQRHRPACSPMQSDSTYVIGSQENIIANLATFKITMF